MAPNLPGEAGAAMRCALGGPTGDVRTRPWWIAAARARSPFDDDQFLLDAGLRGAGQGNAATFDLRLDPKVHTYQDNGRTRGVTWWDPTLVVHPLPAVEFADRPTVVSSSTPYGDGWLPWMASIWPHDGETFFAQIYKSVHYASSRYPEVDYGTRPPLRGSPDASPPARIPGRVGARCGFVHKGYPEPHNLRRGFRRRSPEPNSGRPAGRRHAQPGRPLHRDPLVRRAAATMGAGASVAALLSRAKTRSTGLELHFSTKDMIGLRAARRQYLTLRHSVAGQD
jgi:hypothetical protein